MNNQQRVFITGFGALTACGEADETWNAVLDGRSAIDKIRQWDLSTWEHQLGGELKNFNPAKLLPDRKLLKMISRQDAMGIVAGIRAVEHSHMLSYRETLGLNAALDSDYEKSYENMEKNYEHMEKHEFSAFNEQTAVFVGSPGNKYLQQYDFLPLLAKSQEDMAIFAKELFNEVHPMWLLRILPNNVLAYTGIANGFKGPNHNIANHAVGGTQAILEAYHAIKMGKAKRAVVIAYDIGIEPQALFYYAKLGLISSKHLKDKSLINQAD